MTARLLLFVAFLGAGAASAQELDNCNQKCSDTMITCMGKCSGDMRCANPCQTRMSDCMKRCQDTPQKTTSTGGKGKKCFGADGSKMPCGDYKQTKAPKPSKGSPEEDAQYPNEAAKNLSKDPNFKGVAPQ